MLVFDRINLEGEKMDSERIPSDEPVCLNCNDEGCDYCGPCDVCDGSGVVDGGIDGQECPECGGVGVLLEDEDDRQPDLQQEYADLYSGEGIDDFCHGIDDHCDW